MSEALLRELTVHAPLETVAFQDQKQIHILLVEDEISVRDPLARFLARNACRVAQAGDAAAARRLLLHSAFDLVVLDIMMPGESGLSLCRHIRADGDLPVLLLTARSDSADRILGLEMGADDYVVKPFDPGELLARTRAIVRRARTIPRNLRLPEGKVFAFGSWTLRTAERELVGEDGVTVPLSAGEFRVLFQLMVRPKVVLTRDQLLDLTRGRDAVPFDRSIDNQISRLRKKIEPDIRNPIYIKTIWGGGYCFGAEVRRISPES
jgi:two-component system OmpR family response regulator